MCGSCASAAALELAGAIEDMADEISEKFFHDNLDAMDFADSIREKAGSIADWIEENNHVTGAQEEALGNMKNGAERWLK